MPTPDNIITNQLNQSD